MDYLTSTLASSADSIKHHPIVESTYWYYYYASNWNRAALNFTNDYADADAATQES
tara:strand:- start:271 stop:438 length:168 start_codon:yes stop_codon:yes gene_type:complete